MCNTKVLLSNRSYFWLTNVLLYDKNNFVYDKIILSRTKVLLSDKSTSVLIKVASVNKSMDVTNGAPYGCTVNTSKQPLFSNVI